MEPRSSVSVPQDSRRSPGVSTAAAATPRSATSRWTVQVRGGACKGKEPDGPEERELSREGTGQDGGGLGR